MGSKTNAASYATDWTPLGLDPSQDFIYGYKGDPGKRVTDWEAIKKGLVAGEIKTDVKKMMDYWSSGDGKISKRMGPADYEQGALGQWFNVNWRTGNINPSRFNGDQFATRSLGEGESVSEKVGSYNAGDRLDSLAKYIGAVNTRMNTNDNEMELAHLDDELDALNTNKKRRQEFESGLKSGSGVRYKRALMGSLRTNNYAAGLYRDRGFAVDASGTIYGFPAENPPTYP